MPVNETIERIVYEGVDKITAVSKSAESSVKQLRQSLDAVKQVLGVLGVTVGAGTMLKMARDTIAAVAALDDMAEAAGASVEGLSALQRVAKIGGHDFEGLTSQLGKMVKGLRDGAAEGGRAAQAFAALDIRTKDADGRFRDTSEILQDLAEKLARYEDGGNKMVLVQDALGKGAERYLPLLKDMAEEGRQAATVTARQAAEAEKLEKNINRLGVAFGDARREIVLGMTPAMISLTDKMLDANKAGGLFLATLRAAAEVAGRIGGTTPLGLLGRAAGAGIDAGSRGRPTGSQADVRRIDNALEPPRKLTYQSPDEGAMAKAQKEREFVARQLQEGLEEEQRIQQEAFHWTAFYSDKKLEAAKATEQARIQALIDAYEREQELAVEQGEILTSGASYTQKLEALRQTYLTEEALEAESHAKRLEQLQHFSDAELELFGGRYALIEGMNAHHQARMLDIERNKHQAQRSMEVGTLQLSAGLLQQFAGKSKAAALAVIGISKGLAIAQTMQATAAATMRAYSDLGPIAGTAAAAYIQSLGAIQIGLITATGLVEGSQVGKGPTPQGTFAANPSTGLPVSTEPAGASTAALEPRVTVFNVPRGRGIFTIDDVQDMFELFNEAARKGARLDRLIIRQS